jgi:hypothetical protein
MKQKLTATPPSDFRCVRSLKQCAALVSIILITTIAWSACVFAETDPLPSWNDSASKKAIVDFVEKGTKEGSPDFVKPEERIAKGLSPLRTAGGVPPEQVVGSIGKVKYDYDKEGRPELIKLPEVLLIDDKTGKPEGINMVIGRRPLGAFGIRPVTSRCSNTRGLGMVRA